MSDHLMLFNSYYGHILHYTVLYHTIEYCIKMNVHIILYYCSHSIQNVRTVNTFMLRFWYDYFAVVDFLYYVIYIAICCGHCNHYLKVISITKYMHHIIKIIVLNSRQNCFFHTTILFADFKSCILPFISVITPQAILENNLT